MGIAMKGYPIRWRVFALFTAITSIIVLNLVRMPNVWEWWSRPFLVVWAALAALTIGWPVARAAMGHRGWAIIDGTVGSLPAWGVWTLMLLWAAFFLWRI